MEMEAEVRQAVARSRPFPWAARIAWWLLLVAAFMTAGWMYYRISLFYPKTSDQANSFLAGVDLSKGNWRLRGWVLPSDSYWTSDVLLYSVLVKIFGDRATLLALAPAVSWSLTVFGSLFVACRRLRISQRSGAAVVVLALLGLPLIQLERMYFITESSIHILSTLYCLAGFVLVENIILCERRRRLHFIAYGIVTTLGVIGDPLVFFIGPLAVIAAMIFAPADRNTRLIVGAVTVLSVAAGQLLLYVNQRTGGFISAVLPLSFAGFSQIFINAGIVLRCVLTLFGADFTGRALADALPEVARAAYLVLLAAAAWPVVRLVLARIDGGSIFDDRNRTDVMTILLVSGIAINVGATVFSSQIDLNGGGTLQELHDPSPALRFLFAVLIYGAILIAREYARSPFVAVLSLCCMAVSLHINAPIYRATARGGHLLWPQQEALLDFLERHQVTTAVSSYWNASIISEAAEGAVKIYPAIAQNGIIVPFGWSTKNPVFDFKLLRRFFLVMVEPEGCSDQRHLEFTAQFFTEQEAIRTFGRPEKEYQLPCYKVYSYAGGNAG